MENEEKIQIIAERYKAGTISLIGVLQETSKTFGYLPEEVLNDLATRIEVPISRMYSLATFYSSFRLDPIGREHVCVCVGTACHVRGAPQVVGVLERELGLEAGQTSEDLSYTLETVNCLGACALGPLVTINGEYHGKQDQSSILKLIRKRKKAAEE
jgi:NADH:ubiquinone oxidoreductase subunit E